MRSVVLEALGYSRKITGSRPDEVNQFFNRNEYQKQETNVSGE
jgi:hypothetical protein